MVRENIWKMNFFQVREKSGWQGKFRKDRENSWNLKINSYDRQSSENLFNLLRRRKNVFSH